ncbi:polyprenyl synthetase family protein [Streptomyces rochei]|uniref:polyprenyl synthetase family protein n=1 Tax=Streptomyces TaxID=1883 RepID=UPI001587CDD8|nr:MULTISPECIES: polyprenyl synthetase family protein [unclassified Streptomyces]MBJ6623091.1 polyprenyl synthetase family protein [Streptomyces sp. DHE17-7]NUV97525.1 polyprenyl synthetase family protein [Streptomyces sp. KAI 90]
MTDRWDPAAFKARVDAVLHAFLDEESRHLLAVDDTLAPVAEQLRTAAGHGKRLRAAFCYWGWRAAGQPDSDALVRAAASMELVHAAAVVHDDLIDDSALRHGLPTVHEALASVLARGGHPRARPAARSLAMLVGDQLMALAAELFAASGLPAAYLSRARHLWAALARELVAGECLEILHTGGPPDTGTSLKVVRYKTAKYTVEHPLLIGGLLAGAGQGLRDAYSAYGLPLGEAFQLRDDLLGLFGDPEHTGKEGLDDVRAQRPTALLAETWRAADDRQRARLRGVLGRGDLDEGHLREVRALMRELGAPQRVERMIHTRVEQATRALDTAGVPPHARRALRDLARQATDRIH